MLLLASSLLLRVSGTEAAGARLRGAAAGPAGPLLLGSDLLCGGDSTAGGEMGGVVLPPLPAVPQPAFGDTLAATFPCELSCTQQ